MRSNRLPISRVARRWHAAVMYSWLGLVCLFQVPGILAQDGELSDEEWSAVMRRWAASRNGRFLLSGEVVNQGGEQANGVTLRLEKARLTDGFGEPVYEKETRTINGTFSLNLQGYFSITMTFQAPGYYSEKFTITLPDPKAISDKVFQGEPVQQQVASKNNIRVVLRAVGTLTELLGYNEVLEYEASGRATVVDFNKSHFNRKSLVQIENVDNGDQRPEDSVYILADKEIDGTIATVELSAPGKQTSRTFPQRIRLIMRADSGGFVRFEPPIHRNVFGQMKAAPEAGYQNELVLDETYLRRQIGRSAEDDLGCFFYFKTKDKYGKGRVTMPEIKGSRVRLRGIFRVQPNGSANLETLEPTAVTVLDGLAITSGGDTTAPTMSIIGDNPVSTECGAAYTDAGATATDDTDGNLTASITVSNTVNAAAVGQYTVTYSVSDTAGNPATATRTVNVVDTTPPAFTILGDNPATVECASVYADASATASDGCAGNLTASISVNNTVSTAAPGTNPVTYTVGDPSGNTATATRIVLVVDRTPPQISCPASVTVQCATEVPPVSVNSVTASDTCGAVTVTHEGDAVSGTCPKTITRTYKATDGSGNSATCQQIITVHDTTAPALTGCANQTVVQVCPGTASYVLPTAADNCDGTMPVTCSPASGGSFGPGTHTVTCTATDACGNTGQCSFMLTVLQKLCVKFTQPPLSDDNDCAGPENGQDPISNRFQAGQVIPVKVKLFDCAGNDVTTNLVASVTARLDVTERANFGTFSTLVQDITESYSGVGDAGGVLVLTGGHLQYNLNTTGFEPSTETNNRYFDFAVKANFNSAPGVIVGEEDAAGESKK